MRLIDADAFKKQIAGMAIINNYPPDKANKMCELIDAQPTAYDVDKVVQQLTYLKKASDFCKNKDYADAYELAIETVKGGGVNE